jgi:hypothetical protein
MKVIIKVFKATIKSLKWFFLERTIRDYPIHVERRHKR